MNIKVKSILNRRISRGSNMSVTRAIELARKLKPKLGEETASELLDYIGNQNGDLATKQDVQAVKQDVQFVRTELGQSINWLTWIVGIGFPIGFGTLLTVMLYLHGNTENRMDRIETDVKELKTGMADLKRTVERLEVLIIEGRQPR